MKGVIIFCLHKECLYSEFHFIKLVETMDEGFYINQVYDLSHTMIGSDVLYSSI